MTGALAYKLKTWGLIACLYVIPNFALGQTSDAVQKQINAKGGLLSGMAAKLQASENQVSSLSLEIQQKQQEIQQKNQEMVKIQTLVTALQDRLAEQQKTAAVDTERDLVKTTRIKELEGRLAANQQTVAGLLEKEKLLITLQTQSVANQSLLDGLNAKVREQDGIIIDLRAKLDVTKQDLGSAGGKIGTMEKDLGTMEKDLGALQQNLGTLEKDLGARGSTIAELNADLDQALYKTREREADIARLRSEVIKANGATRLQTKLVQELEMQRLILGGALGLALLGLLFGLRRRR